MSNRNNDVFQVLPTKGNLVTLAAGNTLESLAPGQLGAFDALTNVSFNSATSPKPREFYFALGIDRTGSATLEDIRTSAGQLIQKNGITSYTFKPHTAGQPMVVKVGGYKATSGTEYGIRVEFRNHKIYRIQGYNQFTKAYMVTTPCGDDCTPGCNDLDANLLTKLFVDEINGDEQGLLVAKYVARQAVTTATHGTSVNYAAGAVMTLADVDALITFNLTALAADQVFADFTITSVPLKVAAFYQVHLQYYKFVETVLVTSLIEGFSCSGAVTELQLPVYEEGSGRNIKQKEYHASGWTAAGPYKLSTVTGTAKENIEYLAVETTTYDQFILQYFQTSESGWLEYSNTLSTIIAVPEADTVTRASVATLVDSITTGAAFESLANDAAAASATATVVEPVVTDPALDGLA